MVNDLHYVALALAGIGWAALVLFPRRPWANFWLAGVALPVVLGLFYTVVMVASWNQEPRGQVSGFFSLEGLGDLFDNAGLRLSAFIDLLVIPLMVGAWMARKSAQIGMPYLFLLPCLLLMLTLPGTGVVAFAVIVAAWGRWSQVADFEAEPPANAAPVAARPSAA